MARNFDDSTCDYIQDVDTSNIPNVGTVKGFTVWDVALTDDEIMSIARGINPNSIRPENRVYPQEDLDGAVI